MAQGIQKSLRSSVAQGASISGTEEKGRIALPYSSRGELEYLLDVLGLGHSDEHVGVPEDSTEKVQSSSHGDKLNSDDADPAVAALIEKLNPPLTPEELAVKRKTGKDKQHG